MIPNQWSKEYPEEEGLYAVALDNTLIDIVYVDRFDLDRWVIASLYGGTLTVQEFVDRVAIQGGWHTPIFNKGSVQFVGYNKGKHREQPPLLWNKLIIPPFCYSNTPAQPKE